MSHETDIKTKLSNDGTFSGYMTGGIYTFTETGRSGISRTGTPAAYDAAGLIKPCVIVKSRNRTPTGDIRDEGTGLASYRAVVELWFYSDGYANVSALETARDRAITLLHDTQTTGAKVQWIGDVINDRDPSLENANVLRTDFLVNAIRS